MNKSRFVLIEREVLDMVITKLNNKNIHDAIHLLETGQHETCCVPYDFTVSNDKGKLDVENLIKKIKNSLFCVPDNNCVTFVESETGEHTEICEYSMLEIICHLLGINIEYDFG